MPIPGAGLHPPAVPPPPHSDVESICGRRIEFRSEQNPYNPVKGNSDFIIESLNPSTSSLSSGSVNATKMKSDGDVDYLISERITFRRIGAGLKNLGNTCFLNSVLQCLTYTEPLAAYLQSGKHENSCRITDFCALCAIQRHVSDALQGTGRILIPKDLVLNLQCISQNFRYTRQEDAHEYMIHLLESMHKCCLPSGLPTESPTAYEKSLVHKIFGGRLRSRVKCSKCFHCSDKFDPFLDLSLEIVNAVSLHSALLQFTATEILDDEDCLYFCEQCKQKVKALKQLTVDKAPYVLTIHLKRFDPLFSGQKIDREVYYGPRLDLKPFMSGYYLEDDLKYTLYGVLVHDGRSMHSGHYYCYVRTSTGMWYSLDDNEVVQVDEGIVLDQYYMLFYVRDKNDFAFRSPLFSQKTNIVETTSRNVSASNAHGEEIQIGPEERQKLGIVPNGLMEKDSDRVDDTVFSNQENVSNICSTQSCRQEECAVKCNDTISSKDSAVRSDEGFVSKSGVNDIAQPTKGGDISSGLFNDLGVRPTDVNVCCEDKVSNSNPASVLKPSSFGCELSNPVSTCPQKMELDAQAGACSKNNQFAMMEKKGSDCQSSEIMSKSATHEVEKFSVDLSNPSISTVPPVVIGCVPTASSDHISRRILKQHKMFRSPTLPFCSNVLYRASISIRKKKKGKRKKVSDRNRALKCCFDDVCTSTGPSTSKRTNKISHGRSAHSSSQSDSASRDGEDGATQKNTSDEENSEVGVKGKVDHQSKDVLGSYPNFLRNNGSTSVMSQQENGSGVDLNGNRNCQVRTRKSSIAALGLETKIVGWWDGVELPASKNLELLRSRGSIGYVPDKWDEEYDRGRRKKCKKPRISFDGPNPFQEIATKKAKSKKK